MSPFPILVFRANGSPKPSLDGLMDWACETSDGLKELIEQTILVAALDYAARETRSIYCIALLGIALLVFSYRWLLLAAKVALGLAAKLNDRPHGNTLVGIVFIAAGCAIVFVDRTILHIVSSLAQAH